MSRTRTRGQLAAKPTLREYQIINGGSPTLTGGSVTGLAAGTFESMTDTVVDHFHLRRNRGEVFFNPMAKEKRSNQSFGGTGWKVHLPTTADSHYYYDDDLFQYYAMQCRGTNNSQYLPVGSVFSSKELNDLVVEASTRAMSKVGTSDSNLFETMAEIDQTLRIHTSAMQSLKKIGNSISSTRQGAAGVASGYLLYRYGVSPIIRDAQNVLKAIGRASEKIRVTSRATVNDSKFNTSTYTFGGPHIQQRVLIQDNDGVQVRAMSLDEFTITQAFESGIHLKGALMLPWELIPYSFVVDWFINFGEVLAALLPTPSFKNLGGCVVVKRTRSSYFTPLESTAIGGYTVERQCSGSAIGTWETTQRSPLARPGFVVKSDFRFHNLTRALDATALAVLALTPLLPKRKRLEINKAFISKDSVRFFRELARDGRAIKPIHLFRK